MAAPPTIILLRSPLDDGPDPYEAAFRAAGLAPRSLPVLAHTFHADAVRVALAARSDPGGLVLTSPRAAEALARLEAGVPDAWRAVPTWVVGARTAAAARALGLRTVGEGAGSGEALAAEIVAARPGRRLLFLASDRRRDALPDALAAAGVDLDEVCAYTTHPRADLTPEDLAADWVAFFSPSGVEAARRALRGTQRLAAIGPTTAAALAAAGRPAAAVADEPTPRGLVSAVTRR